MPLYEYQCEECSQRTEVLQRFGAPPKAKCDQCGGALKKLVSAPMVQFKGSGWYVTDYGAKKPAAGRSESSAAAESSDSRDGSREGSKGSSKEGSKESSKEGSKESSRESSKESSKAPSKETSGSGSPASSQKSPSKGGKSAA